MSPEAIEKVAVLVRSLSEAPRSAPAAAIAAEMSTLPRRPRVGASAVNRDAMISPDEGVTDRIIEELGEALAYLAARGHGASPGGYDDWANIGQGLASLKGTEWEAGALALFDRFSEPLPGYGGTEATERKWHQLGGDRSSYKVVFAEAYRRGWPGPRRSVVTAAETAVRPADDDPRPTDLAVSVLWTRRCGDEFRFDHSKQAWMHYEGGAWRYCLKGEHVESFKTFAADLRREAGKALAADPDSKRPKLYMACADRAQSATGTRAALELARSTPGLAVRAEEFDQDPDLFNVANGVIHLPSGELRAHDPALMLHRRSPIYYAPDALCPRFDEFMRQVSCGDDEWCDFMQRSLGYALSGHVVEERMQFWLGSGANGKSVLANLMRHVLGTYAATAPTAFLMQSRRDGGGATPELAMLPGVRLLMANEVEAGAKLSAQTLKVAVSTEHIGARALYGNPFSFKPTHKLIVRGNHRPIITDDDEGIWRRVDLVPFDLNLAPEQRDPTLEDRLRAEAPGILRWMVEGFAKWRRVGLTPPARIRNASLAYRRESDVLGQWVGDCCEEGAMHTTPQRAAYATYRMWCHDQGLRQFSKKSFTRALRDRGFGERRESTGQRLEVYVGFRMRA